MALIQCPECTKDVSDRVVTCPHCGYPMKEETISTESSQHQVELTSVRLKTSTKTKKVVIFTLIIVVIASVSFFFIRNSIFNKTYNTYIDNLISAQKLMLDGGAKAEELCNLVGQVWVNAIYEEEDPATDKYTRPDGLFVDDFNIALNNLYFDSSTMTTVSHIQSNQESVMLIMKELQNPPDGLEKCYDTITELYLSYKKFTDLAISPTGSLNTFTEEKSAETTEFMDNFERLTSQIPNKR